jgi:hypothetical protein
MTAIREDTAPQIMDADTGRWITDLEGRKKDLPPNHGALVDVFIEHLRSEQAADLERYLAHQIPEPVYRRSGAVEWHLSSNVHEWFGSMAEDTFPVYEMETDCFIVTDNLIVTDGVLKMTAVGSKVVAHGMTLPDGGGNSDRYLVYRRFAIFISFEDGRMAGEDTYRDPPSIVKLANLVLS